MQLLLLIVFISSVLLAGFLTINFVKSGKYKRRFQNSEKDEQIKKEFESRYPNKNIKDLKIEIEKISDMLLGNEESNRYTKKVQKKATRDNNLYAFKDLIPDSVDILELDGNQLEAQVNYKDYKNEYTIIMYMNIVAKGRVFLKNYKTMKRRIEES